ncbi:hypothetical protein MAR_033437 [Mya arenaria]|uniref:Uncharacterized protein n=1 Tax=Mya arenaria TaxID=6604 RepID=A0ABY7G8Z8_MYAAR|nr:hypothetical protein MAR_033437 [Mya arenaria]
MEVGKEKLTDEYLYCRIILLVNECGTLTLKELLIKVVQDLTSGEDEDLDKFLFSWRHVDEKFQSIQNLNVTYENKRKRSELDQGLSEEDGDAVVNLEQLAATNVIQEHTRSQILRLTLNNCPEDKYRELVSKFQEALQEEKDCASHSAKQADEHFLNAPKRLSATAEVQPLSEKSSRKAQHIRDIQIKEREERFPCVTGILVIHDKMFLVDSADKRDGNQTIKVVDLKTDTIAYALKLDDIPWDLTSVGEEKIAVTFPMKGDVGFYLHSSENPLLFESNIDVGEGCRGIVYANKTLLVSFAATSSERRGRVEVLSLFGEHLKIFENTENDHMYYISQEDEQEYFFVSDFENNHIITMNDNGKILCEYYDVEMPYGIVSDSSGSLFACSSCCKTAVELNLSTGQAHELIKKQYLRQPRCVAFCKETKLMYIGMWKNNFVKVFRLS